MNHDSQSSNQSQYENSEPTYNLKAVVKETGLKADTLRAWERRYGLPQPNRTESGHRLYSKRDIGILKWLLARQDEGLTISRAVALWERLIEDGVDPVGEQNFGNNSRMTDVANHHSSSSQPGSLPSASTIARNRYEQSSNGQPSYNGLAPGGSFIGGQIAELRRLWISACLNFDESGAEQVINEAFSLFDTEIVCIELIFKGVSEIGMGWAQGRVTVQQEHFASSLATRRLHALLNGTPAPTRPGKIIIGCPPNEEHTLPSNLIALFLRRQGWSVLFLGANIPIKNLHETIGAAEPSLVILTAQQLSTASSLLEMGNVLFEAGVPLGYGGAVFTRSPELQRCIPGHYLGSDIRNATLVVEQLMAMPSIKPAQRKVPTEYREYLNAYENGQAEIEKRVWEAMQNHEVSQQSVRHANRYLMQMICAILSLCGNSVAESEFDILRNLLLNHYGMDTDAIEKYIEAYSTAMLQICPDAHAVVRGSISEILGEFRN